METNNWIALLSFLAALLAALYARWAATAARRQNEIAIHNEKLKIFKAFLDFRSKLTAYGADVPERDLYLDLFPHVQLAEFYYSAAANLELNKFFTCLREMIDLRELAASTRDKDTISKKHAQLDECRRAAKQVEGVMKTELRLIKTHLSLRARLAACIRDIRHVHHLR
jgi:hypothetical protein